jgi:hypothetical protein
MVCGRKDDEIGGVPNGLVVRVLVGIVLVGTVVGLGKPTDWSEVDSKSRREKAEFPGRPERTAVPAEGSDGSNVERRSLSSRISAFREVRGSIRMLTLSSFKAFILQNGNFSCEKRAMFAILQMSTCKLLWLQRSGGPHLDGSLSHPGGIHGLAPPFADGYLSWKTRGRLE